MNGGNGSTQVNLEPRWWKVGNQWVKAVEPPLVNPRARVYIGTVKG